MTSELIAFTEYEEEICFDLDDPDFSPSTKSVTINGNGNNLRANALTCSMEARVPSPMSLAGVHPLEMHGANSNELINRSHSYGALSALSRGSYGSLSSLEDVHQFLSQSEQAVLSIEELRLQLNSCFTCGVSWQEEHVSLDCSECGGYSLERPCPICEGQCDSVWKRDLTMTHASGKARWEGKCGLSQKRIIFQSLSISPDNEAQLCQRLENLKSYDIAPPDLYFQFRHAYGIDAEPKLPHASPEIEGVLHLLEPCLPQDRVLGATKPDVSLKDRENKAISAIELSCPACLATNTVAKDREKRDSTGISSWMSGGDTRGTWSNWWSSLPGVRAE